LVRVLFGVLGLGFAVLAMLGTSTEIGSDITWSPAAVGAGIALVAATTLMAARLWAALNTELPRAASRAIYYAAIVGKYIPGGVFQFAGQVGYTARAGPTVARAATTYALSMVTTVGAGLIVCGSAAFATGFPLHLRVLAGIGSLVGITLTRRSILQSVVDRVLRLTKRNASSTLPDQRSINESVAWGVVGLAFLAASFVVVASQIAGNGDSFSFAAAILVAWLAGFLAIPFPAGIGVREATLVWLLSPTLAAGPVVAASLAHRLITMASEVIVYLASRARRKALD
jgi:hypothetical protein